MPTQGAAKKRPKHSLLLILAIAVFVCVIAVACILNYSAAAQNNRKAQEAQAQCSEIAKQNATLESFLDDENHDEYYEKIAREQYDYAADGERVFNYDSSDE